MAYTIKPSVGMLPIDDLGKVMAAQGFIKDLKPKDIENVTAVKDVVTGSVVKPGIKDPTLIALCVGKTTPDGSIDRETVKNALNLGGKSADQYLVLEDKELISTIIETVNKAHSDEIKLLRDEMYHLKSELVRTGHIEDTGVADGYIDGFKKSNIKFSDKSTEAQAINGLYITQSEKVFEKDDWLVARKDRSDVQSNAVANVIKESGNDIQIDIGTSNMTADKTVLMKSLGEYNRGSFSFSSVSYGTPGVKENYTMLNDDSNVSKLKINSDNTGFATVLKIPKRCAGFLTKFSVNGKVYGNPGAIVCHVIKGSYEYINQIARTNGLSQAAADGNLVASSNTVNANAVKDGEIIFDFTRLNFNPNDSTSTLYPEVEGTDYCFVIEADNVSELDYWEIEFGHKKNAPLDLQTNNRTYRFYNKDVITVGHDSFVEVADIDMLYMATTKVKEDEDEIPYSVGLYTTLNPIKMSKPITASRARLTLEVNKEGNFVSSTHGTIRAELDTIEFRKADGTYAEQTVIGGGDNLIVGNSIVKAKTSSPNTVTIDKSVYVEPMMPIYRCGYKAQVKVCLMEEDPVTKIPTVKLGSQKTYPLELVAVIPSGRNVGSTISDRLIFEIDMDDINDINGEPLYFNQAELQIQWSSFLSSSIIHTQAKKGNDYVGRIHSMSLAFDKTV